MDWASQGEHLLEFLALHLHLQFRNHSADKLSRFEAMTMPDSLGGLSAFLCLLE